MLSFKPAFSLSFFTCIKRLFSSSSLFCHKGGIICISEVFDISPGNLDSSLCFFQSSVSHDVLGLKLSVKKSKIMASGPITSWQIDEETVEAVADFIFLGSKITADGDCNHEIKRRLLL